jgi:phosphoglycerol transferase MdoB-like AlkP superfamily enzyme
MTLSLDPRQTSVFTALPSRAARGTLVFARTTLWKFVFAYVVLLTVSAFLGRWTPEFLQGRDMYHFLLSRMVVPALMLGVFASFMRLIPATLLLGATLLFIGAISAIKREATGEPFQVSDLFLAGQSMHLFGYVGWDKWLMASAIVPASAFGLFSLRFRPWSLPLLALCVGLLSTYRIERVVQYIHDNSYWLGVENLTFSQAESERMNGLATHLYFSTAGLRLKTYSADQVKAALDALDVGPVAGPRATPAPDIFIVLGEAWWRDPSDQASPLDKLTAAGFAEGTAVSPVYGGTTPNAEFEVLTGVPIKSFQSGIIPYQHYLGYLTDQVRSLPHLLEAVGYQARAFHNFTARFWLRDKVYPKLGFDSFDSMDDMKVTMQPNGWPTDTGLYNRALDRLDGDGPHVFFLVTVETHGPYAEDKQRDLIDDKIHPGITDYHTRLSGAADALLAFDKSLRQRGKPYVLLAFGDHLPGLRLHQWKYGMKSESDPRLHQVPFLISSNSEAGAVFRDRFDGRPLYCLSPSLVDWLQLGVSDRYFRHLAKACAASTSPGTAPSEAVIQNQLFTKAPITQ